MQLFQFNLQLLGAGVDYEGDKVNAALRLLATIRADATSVAFYKRRGAVLPVVASTQLIPSEVFDAECVVVSYPNPICSFSGTSHFHPEYTEEYILHSSTCRFPRGGSL